MNRPPRLLSLDALRGYTIAAMIIVNTPGSWSAVYSPLRHASWHGLTPTDLVFPFFLFIVGVSIALAYSPPDAAGVERGTMHRKILLRTVKIFAVGIMLNLWPHFDLEQIRFAGVLPRIAIVFGITAMLFLHLPWRSLAGLTAAILLGYWGLLSLIPVPRDAVIEAAVVSGTVERAHGTIVDVSVVVHDDQNVAPNLEPGANLAAWFDRAFLPARFYEKTWDPEGWLSTLPSIATALLGLLAGIALRRFPDLITRVKLLSTAGLVCLLIGTLWSLVFPFNKNLWTSSFVLATAGWALLLFAACLWIVDGKGWRRGAFPGIVFGANAITAYTLAGMLTIVVYRPLLSVRSPAENIVGGLTALGLSTELASLLFSLSYTTLIFIPAYLLYRRKIFLRL